MSDELIARAELFASIEGGSIFWSNEIVTRGVLAVKERLLAGTYTDMKNSGEKILSRLKSICGEKVLEEIAKANGTFITPSDHDWPEQLMELASPPIGLIIKGNRDALAELGQSISIVGTRNPTSYGARIAGDFAAGLADRHWLVVSGGAFGIDAAAHKGSLAAEGTTLAILGAGISKSYPSSHDKLFNEICESGLLISEVMPQVPALPFRFLTRNRLIAALSKSTLVVEAAYRSGSLRTARDAAEIFRPVMAVPGPINVPTSEGCHRLITERCAELVSSVSDILELVMPLAVE